MTSLHIIAISTIILGCVLYLTYSSKEPLGLCFPRVYTNSKSIKSLLTSNPKTVLGIQNKKCLLDSMFINNNTMYLPNDAPNVCASANRV